MDNQNLHNNNDNEKNYKLTCLECKNEIDLSNYTEKIKEFEKDRNCRVVIECNHCATDHLVLDISSSGDLKTEIVEMEK